LKAGTKSRMKAQNFQVRDSEVIQRFVDTRKGNPEIDTRLNLSWSNWCFGIESLEKTVARLARHKVRFIELHGNRYGPDLGYKSKEVKKVLDAHGMKVSGVCGIASPECELSSINPHVTQRSIDYFRRNIDLCAELGGAYLLFTPGAVGRPEPYDENEFHRAARSIRILGDHFKERNVRAAIEPVRSAEVSFCHTFREAKMLIEMVDHPGVKHIAGDVFHMLTEEEHLSGALLEYGHMLTNLHMADTNRRALGQGSLDLDLILMALYVVGFNNPSCFCTAEPLGPGGDPYPAMFGMPDSDMMDRLVAQTASCFYERENEILDAAPDDLRR